MSDILNNAEKQIPPESDPYKVASDFLDKIFYLIPSYGGFDILEVIEKSDLSTFQKITANYVLYEIKSILKGKGCLEVNSQFGNLNLELNSHGREVKNAGGIYAYKTKESTPFSMVTNIHQGDNYGQVVQGGYHSSSPILQSSISDKKNKGKRSRLEIISWVVGIMAGIIAVYEFIIKK